MLKTITSEDKNLIVETEAKDGIVLTGSLYLNRDNPRGLQMERPA